MQWNYFKIIFVLTSSFQYATILLGKSWQPWKLLEFSNTPTLASYKLVSYKKECIAQYGIKKLINYSLKIQNKKIPSLAELWVNKCTTFLFWNIRTRLIHDNTRTPSSLHLNAVETNAPSISWCFVSRSSAWFTICWMNKFSNFHPNLIQAERPW